MNESNLTLFKQALCEGLSNRIDHLMSECNEKAHCSKRHKIAMRTIVYGKIGEKRTITPKMRWIIAILVSAAIILTSCAIVYRDRIIRIIKYIPDYVMGLTYSEEDSKGRTIETVYELTYVPDGYVLTKSNIQSLMVQYVFTDSNENQISFQQSIIDNASTYIDQKNAYNEFLSIDEYKVYYSTTQNKHFYIWNDGKYTLLIQSNLKLTNKDVLSIINGIKTK